jgi:hypothetical protein
MVEVSCRFQVAGYKVHVFDKVVQVDVTGLAFAALLLYAFA